MTPVIGWCLHRERKAYNKPMRILLIEDDCDIGDGVQRALQRHGFAVDWLTEGPQGQAAVDTVAYDAAILDLGLPQIDGLDILSHWRGRGIDFPVLILTARNATPDRVVGLNSGADDYLGKPFESDELLARLNALLRRQRGQADSELRYGGLCLNTATQTATLRDEPLKLRRKELVLLELLLTHPKHIISRAQIEDKLYNWDSDVESNTIEVHIHSLRKQLGKGFIVNHRGLGYQLGQQPHE